MNLNKVFLIGNLTRDPEARTTPSGQSISSFGLATNRIFTDANGQKQQQVEFHNIVAFGRLADICNQYLTKGKLVFIEGRLTTRSWEGQDGVKRSRTEIIAERLQMGPKISPPEAIEAETKSGEEDLPTISSDEEINPEEIEF